MRPAALVLILLAAGPAEKFEGYVSRAAQRGELARPEVRVVNHRVCDDCIAWVRPPLPVIWVNWRYLQRATAADLCDTAYHEVCHLWLREHHLRDDPDHRDVKRCMRKIGAYRCLILKEPEFLKDWR